MHLDSGHGMGWHIPKPVTGTKGPEYVVGEELPITSPEILAQILGGDPFIGIRPQLYPTEIARTLQAAEVAASIHAAVLFDRPVDDVILSAAESLHSNQPVTASAVGVKLVLPYLEGVPSKRLLELRETIPDSFREFRGKINDIVLKAMREEPADGLSLAQARIEAEMSGSINQLEGQIAAISAKTRLHGYGAVVPVLGVLAGSMIGVGSLEVLGAATVASVGYALRAAAESAKDRKLATLNPFYFIWQAKRKST
jgi:hypothetical protein